MTGNLRPVIFTAVICIIANFEPAGIACVRLCYCASKVLSQTFFAGRGAQNARWDPVSAAYSGYTAVDTSQNIAMWLLFYAYEHI